MSDKDTFRYINYNRKSSEAKEKQALSIESQREKAQEAYGTRKVVAVLEESHSAFIPDARPVFKEMIEMLKSGKADGIIAWHPDRLSRNEKDAAEITYLIRTGVIKNLLFVSYTFNNSPEGILFLQMALNQSQYSSAKLSVDVKRGLEKKIKLGLRPGTAPHGYKNTKFADRGSNYVVEDPEHFPIIRKMWDMMLTGNYGPTEILETMNNEWGFRTRQTLNRGGTPLSKGGLYRMLSNPFYAGWMEYAGAYERGKHLPMVTDVEFDRVQVLLGRYGRRRPQRNEYAYNGCVACGECGGFVSATFHEKKEKTTGLVKSYTSYYCTTARRKEEKCSQRHYTDVAIIEDEIEAKLASITILPFVRDWAIEIIDEMSGEQQQAREAVNSARHKALQSCEQRLKGLMDLASKKLISDEEFSTARADIKAEQSNLISQSVEAERNAEKYLELTKDTFHFATYARKAFLKGDAKTRREILEGLSGLNCVLKDHAPIIQAVEWLEPIEKASPVIRETFSAFEPELALTCETKNAFEHFRPVLRGQPDLNRQPLA